MIDSKYRGVALIIKLLLSGQIFLRGEHGVVRFVAANGISPVRSGFEGFLWIGGKRRCDNATGAVEMNRARLRVNDEGATAAADESYVKRSL